MSTCRRQAFLVLVAGLFLCPPALAVDKWSLWTDGVQLRGANVHQRRVYPFDGVGPGFMGPGPLGPPFTQADFTRLKNDGANLVVLSHPGLHAETAPYALDVNVQANLDNLIGMAQQAGLYIVIAFRTGPGRSEATFNYFPPGYTNEQVWQAQPPRDAWVSMWQYTANRYKNNPYVVGYDLMVEPNRNAQLGVYDPAAFYQDPPFGYRNTLNDWNPLHAAITAGIRGVDAETPIIIGGMSYSSIFWLNSIVPTTGAKTVYATHYYEPFNYTHQEPFDGGPTYPGLFDPDPFDGVNADENVNKAWLANSLSPIDTFKAAHPGVPVVVGEFGVKRWAPGAGAYVTDLTEVFEEKGVSHFLWFWASVWPGQRVATVDDFDFRVGPDPNNHGDVTTSPLIEAIHADWARNDAPPALSIGDASVPEGNAGSSNAAFTVTLAPPSVLPVTVQYATSNGSASQPGDYTSTSGTLTFQPDETSKTILVSIAGDLAIEPDETFTVTLSSSTNATLADAVGTGTIANDDGAPSGPQVFLYDRNVTEGSDTNASFRIDVSPPSTQTVTIDYTTLDGTAVAGSDYTATSGTLTFTPGRNAHSVIVPILTDATPEGRETFFFQITSVTGATLLDGQAVGTIDDPPASANVFMYRAYNPTAFYHFFTTSAVEKDFAVANGYDDENLPTPPFRVASVVAGGRAAIFRMYNPNTGRHYYTSNADERDGLRAIGWVYEKVEGFVEVSQVAGTTALHRLYNNISGTHLYTVNAGEKAAILAAHPGIWEDHGSLGFAAPP